MAIREYEVETYGISADDFGDSISMNTNCEYGVIDDANHFWNIDWDYVNDALEENEDFKQALSDEGFEVNFDKYEPAELYRKLTGTSIESLFEEFCDFEAIGMSFEDAYNVLRNQAEEAREYLEGNDKIEVTYMQESYENELYVTCEFEAEESVAIEVKDKLKEIENVYTNKLQASGECHHYCDDPKFGIELFSVRVIPELEANEFFVNEM